MASPLNEQQPTIAAKDDAAVNTTNESSKADRINFVEIYKAYCSEAQVRPNSGVLTFLSKDPYRPPLRLELGNNYIGPKGFHPILDLISRCQTIENIDLSQNGLNNGCIQALVEILATHLGMASVNLSGNPITVEGGKHLMKLLEKNVRIVELKIDNTDMFSALSDRIEMATKENYLKVTGSMPQVQSVKPMVARAALRRQIHSADGRQKVPTVTPVKAEAVDGSTPILQRPTTAQQHSVNKVHVGFPTPRPPPPASASAIYSTRLTEAQREELKERYKRRSEGYGQVEQLSATKAARAARTELEMLEVIDREQLKPPSVQPTPVRSLQEELKQALVPTEEKKSPTATTPKKQEGTAQHPAVEEKETPKAITENKGEVPKKESETLLPTEKPSNNEAEVRSQQGVMTLPISDEKVEEEMQLHPDAFTGSECSRLALTAEQQFKTLFNMGCRQYSQHNLDEALGSWTEAMALATEEKNREWMAIMAHNLQRLSYELLVNQGTQNLVEGKLESALRQFNDASDLAVRARNSAWEAEMVRAKKTVIKAKAQQHHEKATKLFDQYLQYKDVEVTKDNDAYELPNGERVYHSAGFVNEWEKMLLVKEAFENWGLAFRANTALMDTAQGKMLAEVLQGAVTNATNILQATYFIEEPEDQVLSLMRTRNISGYEKRQLLRLWVDLFSQTKSMEQPRWDFLAHGVIGHLLLGTYQLQEALHSFKSMAEAAEFLQDSSRLALASTYLGIVYLQRSHFSEAERVLKNAAEVWREIRLKTARQGAAAPNTKGYGSESEGGALVPQTCNDPIFTEDFVCSMHTRTLRYLVIVMVGMYRRSEALEILESRLLHKFADTLYSKMILNFLDQPTIHHITAAARTMHTPLVYYMLADRFEWSHELDGYLIEQQLYIWAVPPAGELRMAVVEICVQYHVEDIQTVITELRSALTVDPKVEQSGATEQQFSPSPNKATSSGMVLDLPSTVRWKGRAQLLYQILLSPIIDFVKAHCGYDELSTFCVIPDSYIWLVPFPVLMDEKNSFAVEVFAFSHAFCATQISFSALTAVRVRSRNALKLVCVSEPNPANKTTSVKLPFEPDELRSQKECEVIQAQLNAEMAPSDVTGFKDSTRNMRILHFSSSVHNGEEPHHSTPGLCLSSSYDHIGVMSSEAVSACDLPAELVSLSATNISKHLISEGGGRKEGTLKTIRSFFAAGSCCVAFSIWCTPEMAPVDFFTYFYEFAKKEKNKAKAMAMAAQRVMSKDGDKGRYMPMRWAGYVLLGAPQL